MYDLGRRHPPTHFGTVCKLSLTRCRRHDKRVLNAPFDARNATDVRHVAAASLEALHTFAHVFGLHRKHRVYIVQPRSSHFVSHRRFPEYVMLYSNIHVAQRVSRRRFLRVLRRCQIDGPWKSPQARQSSGPRSTSMMKLQGMIAKKIIHRRT